MKILLYPLQFRNYTGSELYNYELGRELVNLGHEVWVTAHYIDNPLVERAEAVGIRLARTGKLAGEKFDAIITSQNAPTKVATEMWSAPIIQVVHSETNALWEIEKPLIDEKVKHYIAIRPAIYDRIQSDHKTLIWNPIDQSRFYPRPMPPHERKRVLFAGTMGPLREPSARHLVDYAGDNHMDVWFVGMGDNYPFEYPFVYYYPATWDMEDYLAVCDETAGILVGRTTIEGWCMGKPGYVYDINDDGSVRGVEKQYPRWLLGMGILAYRSANLAVFDSANVAREIEQVVTKI